MTYPPASGGPTSVVQPKRVGEKVVGLATSAVPRSTQHGVRGGHGLSRCTVAPPVTDSDCCNGSIKGECAMVSAIREPLWRLAYAAYLALREQITRLPHSPQSRRPNRPDTRNRSSCEGRYQSVAWQIWVATGPSGQASS